MPADPMAVGVVGAGVMGAEIALVAALAGHPVVLRDVDPARVDAGLAHAASAAERMVSRGRLDASARDAAVAAIAPATADDALAGCGLVVEAVPERMDVKEGVFRALDAALPPGAILASNTSGLSITALGRFTSRPDRVIGLHFFNPPVVMALVEVIRGDDTSPATVDAATTFVSGLGKTPVAVAECPGFLVNRVLVRAMTAAYAAAGDGADRAAADAAVVAGGPAPMGPFALGDLVGLDTLDHIRRDLVGAYGDRFDDGGTVAPLVAAGRLGRKSGGGFFDGPVESGAPGEAEQAVADAYYAAARDEARRVVGEHVASEDDVDVALRLGAGWERGPLT